MGFTAYTIVVRWHLCGPDAALHERNDERLLAESRDRATAIGDCFLGRRNQAVELAERHDIDGFLLTRDLGMSKLYGLFASIRSSDQNFVLEREHRTMRDMAL